MSKTTVRTNSVIKNIRNLDFSLHNFFYYHLGDPVTPVYCERLFAVVYHYQIYKSAIVGIDRARSIYQTYAVFYSQAAPWPYLSLETCGYTNINASRYKLNIAWQ